MRARDDDAEPLGHRPMEAGTDTMTAISAAGGPDTRNAESVGSKYETVCTDGVVALRECQTEDAQWYADSTEDPDIQRFTTGHTRTHASKNSARPNSI